MVSRTTLAVLAPLLLACSPAPTPGAETPPAPPAPSAEPPPTPAPLAPAETATPATGGALRATVAMKMSGTVVPEKLVAEVNRQIAPMAPCAALVRRTDRVVGSLNLRLVLDKNGQVSTDLQSPVNDEAKRCILDGARAWKVTGAGEGSAMLLLELDDAPAK